MYPKLLELGVINIYTYGLFVAAAYLIGLQVAVARGRSRGLDPNRLMGLGFAILLGAIVGAKLLLFVVDIDYFTSDPANLWVLARSAGVFYGGFVLAVVVAFWYMRRHRMPVWTTCDAFAPGIAVGQAVGRLGCLLAGCCYGRPTDVPWGNHVHEPTRRGECRHAAACGPTSDPTIRIAGGTGHTWHSSACRTARSPVSRASRF